LIRPIAVSAMVLLASACNTTAPAVEIRTVEVKVPVATPCVPKTVVGRPDYQVTRETLQAAPGADERYRQAVVGMLERDARLAVVEPVLEGCR